jgi:HAE1 family hydrophobic/amphiphilic exporter-1
MIQLTRFSLRRAAVIVLATFLLSLLGGYSASRLNVDLLPDIEFPVVSIVTVYPGASPDDVNNAVTIPIEGIISGTSGLTSLTSTSSEGVAVTVAQYDFGTDLDEVERALTNGLNTLALPQGVVRPQLNRFNFNNFPVITLGLLGDTDPAELEALANSHLVPELRGLPGVARVDVTGGAQRQVRLTIDPQKLAASGLTLTQVTGALQGNNLILPAGTIVEGSQSIPVRAGAQFTSLDEIKNLVVGAKNAPSAPASAPTGPPAGVGGGAPGGPPAGIGGAPTTPATTAPAPATGTAPAGAPELVRLADIATVELTNAPNATLSRTNGKPSVGIQIVKAQGANTVEVVDGVKAEIEELRASGTLPANVQIATVEDQSVAIRESISGLIKEGLIGALFAVIVIFVFLRNLRLTLVAAISIPTSVLASFILMDLGGLSLNIFTLGALAIAIGRVVDDGIVVLENIARRYGAGEELGSAILEGTREVAGAITASTLTTVAVFMPIGLVGGITSQFFLPFALTVVFALIASLVVGLTIIPVFARLFIGRRSSFKEEQEGRLERIYLRSLRWTLGHRALALGLAFALLVGSFGLVPFIGTAFLPASGQKLIRIAATAPAGASQATTDGLARTIEAEVARGTNLETYSTTVGANARELAFGSGGTTSVSVSALYTGAADVEAEAERLRAATRGLPNLATINIEVVQNGPPGQNQLQVIVTGNDFAQVSQSSERVLAATRGVAGLTNVTSDLAAAKPEISVRVDPNQAAARGLNAVAVAGQVRSLITGQTVTQVALGAGRVEVYALFTPAQGQAAVDQVSDLTVFGAAGPVRVGDVATVERSDGPTQILRVDRERAVTISATITGSDLGAVTGDVRAAIDGLGLPAGVTATVGGASEAQSETFAALGVALLVAIVLVYIVMVGTFGNLRDPFVILFSLPLALIGAIAALFLTGRALGLPALIGLLLLIGIVVTNAIVLLDRVKQQRERGLPYREALLEAARTRLRPILMTAFATILALMPLALGLNEGAIVAAELATVVIGGLLTSTLLTLLIIPAIYSLFEDGLARLKRRRDRGDDDTTPTDPADSGDHPEGDEQATAQRGELVAAGQ